MKHIWVCAALMAGSLAIAAALRQATRESVFPLPVRLEESEEYRLIGKRVLAQRGVDAMESPAGWTVEGPVHLRQSATPVHEGKYSLEMRFPIRVEPAEPRKNGEAGLGEAHANRAFCGEDWSAYNRISYWIYVEAPGHPYIQVRTSLFNDGKPANPQPQISPAHFTNLRIGQWDHVVWEIPDLARNKVTRLQIAHEIRGKPMEAGSDEVSFFIDDLEIQKVEADYNQGWAPAPGQIAYSHTGYPTWGTKAAYASGLNAANFSVVRTDNGKAVFQGRVAPLATPSAKFQVMDFTSLRTPGAYVLKAGERSTRPFRIAANPWDGALWKTLSFFYAMRCGMKVSGIHDECHMDFFSEHGGRRLVVNGGWHDAADLSQNKWNTAEAVYAMYRLAEHLERSGADAAVQRQLLNEAEWGLDWLLKTDFRDGWRHVSSAHRFWSNNRAGDNDDVIVPARRDPNTAFLAAEAEAVAARVLKRRNPKKAAESLELAEITFRDTYRDITSRRDGNLDMLSAAVTAAAELHAATGKQEYAARAAELARQLLDCQERRILPEFAKPIAGYFYSDSSKRRLAQSGHFGIEHKPIVALVRLAEVLPDHPDWSRWYAAVAIHSDYYLRLTSGLTAPYGHPVNSLVKATDSPAAPLDRRSGGALAASGVSSDWRQLVRSTHAVRRRQRDVAGLGQGFVGGLHSAAERGIGGPLPTPALLVCRHEPLRQEPALRRGLRLVDALLIHRRHSGLAVGRDSIPRREATLLAGDKQVGLPRNLDAPGLSLDVGAGGFESSADSHRPSREPQSDAADRGRWESGDRRNRASGSREVRRTAQL